MSERPEIFVDNFAGGGGASTGIERGIGRYVDVALNHCRKALAMHRMNHPQTWHVAEDIMTADPVAITGGRPVGGVWFSPDCKHFSKAKGGKPRSKKIRGLAWSVIHWVNAVAPRVIFLENVEEFQTWCPLDHQGSPSKWRRGWFFQCFIGALRRRGYRVEWRELRACDYGAPTIRKRFFLIARRDGRAITWPSPTHARREENRKKRLKPHRTIAECLDFTLPCPSIFLTREEARAVNAIRPLAPATMARIAKGTERYVLKAKRPFLVSTKRQMAAYYLAQHNGGFNTNPGHPVDAPASTISATGSQQQLVSAFCVKYYGTDQAHGLNEPTHTVTTRDRFGLVSCRGIIPPLTPELATKARRVAAFLRMHGIKVAGEFACVGEYVLVDIGMRMLRSRELFNAQGFPPTYIIDRGLDEDENTRRIFEIRLTGTDQVRMCGNSVCPPLAEALVAANLPDMQAERRAA